MQYALLFLEGVITFISPCMLPMLPIYFSYFAAGDKSRGGAAALKNSAAFVAGFTLVYISLGALAGALGGLVASHRTALNIITGGIVIVFGLNYLGVLNISFLNRTIRASAEAKVSGFWSAFVLGVVFSFGWTPCVGAFAGTAFMMASRQGSVLAGVVMLLVYSLGLGIPFVLSAVLLDRLKSSFSFLKRNYRVINAISGVFLVVVGLLMTFGEWERVFSFLQ